FARPGTGFICDLYALGANQFAEIESVVAPNGTEADLLKAIANARSEGLRVVQLVGNDDLSSIPYATPQWVLQNGQWNIEKS
ncbi:ATP phosphoribosyltransferase regulatory subunit, partial [Acinetobacter baumannii]